MGGGSAASRIVLLTGSSLCHNPRALKEAGALARAGHRVTVLGAWYDAGFKARDQRLVGELPFDFVPVLDATLGGTGEVAQLARRSATKAAQVAYSVTGWQSPRLLGLSVGSLLRHALQHPADLYIAHSEPALHVAGRLLQQGRRVALDLEDWFSEDLLPEARRHRPLRLLRRLERLLLTEGACSFCPSEAMAAAVAQAYGCRPPTVIYNAFPSTDRQALEGSVADRRDRSVPSLYWFSTSLGPGRGIEDLLAALPFLAGDCEIHLRARVAPDFAQHLRQLLPERWRPRLHFHALADNGQLLARIAEHDIGFAGELPECRSRDLTLTNKVLHYLLAGRPVVASDTAGQREAARRASGAVRLYPAGNARALAAALDEFLSSRQRRRAAGAAALAAAERVFCWERQEETLVGAVAAALSADRDRSLPLAGPRLRDGAGRAA